MVSLFPGYRSHKCPDISVNTRQYWTSSDDQFSEGGGWDTEGVSTQVVKELLRLTPVFSAEFLINLIRDFQAAGALQASFLPLFIKFVLLFAPGNPSSGRRR